MASSPAGLLDWPIVQGALVASLRKLDPRELLRNPVILSVEVVSVAGHRPADRRPRPGHRQPDVRDPDRDLAVADRPVRELRRGPRRGPRQGPGRRPAQDAHDDDGPPARRRGREVSVPAPDLRKGDLVVCEAGDLIPGRRRHRRGHRERRRVGHHRRVRARDPRVRRRPLERHRRHARAVRPDRRLDHRQPRRDASSTA